MMENSLMMLSMIFAFIIIVPFAFVVLFGEKSEDPRVKTYPFLIDNESTRCGCAHIRDFGVHQAELGSLGLPGFSPIFQSQYVIEKKRV
jgi:hypothetical protein